MLLAQRLLRREVLLQQNLNVRFRIPSSPRQVLTSAHSPISRIQASSILTVCHLEGAAPPWSASQRYYDLTESFPESDGSVDHITFLFLRNGHNTRATWTFEFPKWPENLLQHISLHTQLKPNDEDHELKAAFCDHVSRIHATPQHCRVATAHFVRYGFQRPHLRPLIFEPDVEQSAVPMDSNIPRRWCYEESVMGKSMLVQLVDREQHLTSPSVAELFHDLVKPVRFVGWLESSKGLVGEFRTVAKLVRARSGTKRPLENTIWTDDKTRALLSCLKKRLPVDDMPRRVGASTENIHKALRKLSGLPLVSKHYGVLVTTLGRPQDQSVSKIWAPLVRSRTKLPWSDVEVGVLIEGRMAGWSPKHISKKTFRSARSIRKALQILGTGPFPVEKSVSPLADTHKDTTATSGNPTAIFSLRLEVIWTALLESENTPAFTRILARKTRESWLHCISERIPVEVKALLVGQKCPTFEGLRAMPPVDSTDAGVYARLVESRYEFKMKVDRLVYVGSASRFNAGLTGRMKGHLSSRSADSRLQHDIERRDLCCPGDFITLMQMPFTGPSPQDIFEIRAIVTVAEAVLTVWLGALRNPSALLRDAFPWSHDEKNYTPWSSYNPIEKDFLVPLELDPVMSKHETKWLLSVERAERRAEGRREFWRALELVRCRADLHQEPTTDSSEELIAEENETGIGKQHAENHRGEVGDTQECHHDSHESPSPQSQSENHKTVPPDDEETGVIIYDTYEKDGRYNPHGKPKYRMLPKPMDDKAIFGRDDDGDDYDEYDFTFISVPRER